MDITLADQYYLKAKDAYPYCMSEVMENLNYALSYDDNHPQANCLMGIVQMYQLKDYPKAAASFDMALMEDGSYIDILKHYILLKIWTKEYEGANKLIQYGFTIPGMDHAVLYYYMAIQYEVSGSYKKAITAIKQAVMMSQSMYLSNFYIAEIKRIKAKRKLRKKLLKPSK